jgi:hypothetical protein
MGNKIPAIIEHSKSFIDNLQFLNHKHEFVQLVLLHNFPHAQLILIKKDLHRGYFSSEVFQYLFIKRLNRLLFTCMSEFTIFIRQTTALELSLK